ncbi:hypothetical protein Ddc_10888 [Ditylenchus destructor]|nr:hypothetical protein Ddc_10888 [Ditylenchus destructor]
MAMIHCMVNTCSKVYVNATVCTSEEETHNKTVRLTCSSQTALEENETITNLVMAVSNGSMYKSRYTCDNSPLQIDLRSPDNPIKIVFLYPHGHQLLPDKYTLYVDPKDKKSKDLILSTSSTDCWHHELVYVLIFVCPNSTQLERYWKTNRNKRLDFTNGNREGTYHIFGQVLDERFAPYKYYTVEKLNDNNKANFQCYWPFVTPLDSQARDTDSLLTIVAEKQLYEQNMIEPEYTSCRRKLEPYGSSQYSRPDVLSMMIRIWNANDPNQSIAQVPFRIFLGSDGVNSYSQLKNWEFEVGKCIRVHTKPYTHQYCYCMGVNVTEQFCGLNSSLGFVKVWTPGILLRRVIFSCSSLPLSPAINLLHCPVLRHRSISLKMLGLLLILAVLGAAFYLHFQLSRTANAAKTKRGSARNATLVLSTTTAVPEEKAQVTSSELRRMVESLPTTTAAPEEKMREASSELHRFVESLQVSTPEQSEVQVSNR